MATLLATLDKICADHALVAVDVSRHPKSCSSSGYTCITVHWEGHSNDGYSNATGFADSFDAALTSALSSAKGKRAPIEHSYGLDAAQVAA